MSNLPNDNEVRAFLIAWCDKALERIATDADYYAGMKEDAQTHIAWLRDLATQDDQPITRLKDEFEFWFLESDWVMSGGEDLS